mmetsp:Transcript_29266/g.59870  ORF Transcript_29266/g.59870 Transcript_29266/m.59870 type:complete len:300 (-) Transcript_29266:280-1179(-)
MGHHAKLTLIKPRIELYDIISVFYLINIVCAKPYAHRHQQPASAHQHNDTKLPGTSEWTRGHGEIDFNYRIGDCIGDNPGSDRLRERVARNYPRSLVAEYVKLSSERNATSCVSTKWRGQTQLCHKEKLENLNDALVQRCPESPQHLAESGTVVHIRLGDSLCANSLHVVTTLRPTPPQKVAEAIESSAYSREKPCYIYYATHGGCFNQSQSYINALGEALLFLSKRRRPLSQEPLCRMEVGVGWQDADRHFCNMVSSHVFMQGAGGFSYVAERLRGHRGMQSNQTLVETPMTWLSSET